VEYHLKTVENRKTRNIVRFDFNPEKVDNNKAAEHCKEMKLNPSGLLQYQITAIKSCISGTKRKRKNICL